MNNSCFHVTGRCFGCVDGYKGIFCDLECPKGSYGEGCNKTCSEHCGGYLNSCHHVNGSCNQGCDPGYKGYLCTQACDKETYGYTGAKCDQKCPQGYYGKKCTQICSDHCSGDVPLCHHVTGTCDLGCDPGYRGNLCTNECNKGLYGEDCNKTCSEHCGGDLNSCHHVNGSCNQECDPGYTGSLCIQGETIPEVGMEECFNESCFANGTDQNR
ncbi:hypothetical protein RRG08_004560 [Elysia crispata]|uniref:Uncharacterized protein n=1 Tax=Elysia crispata TaxID=231223 RepID=A0AAE0YUT0_9GAST|nr:hypothetical protein RRG08_004560 [Elysia crispata]